MMMKKNGISGDYCEKGYLQKAENAPLHPII